MKWLYGQHGQKTLKLLHKQICSIIASETNLIQVDKITEFIIEQLVKIKYMSDRNMCQTASHFFFSKFVRGILYVVDRGQFEMLSKMKNIKLDINPFNVNVCHLQLSHQTYSSATYLLHIYQVFHQVVMQASRSPYIFK